MSRIHHGVSVVRSVVQSALAFFTSPGRAIFSWTGLLSLFLFIRYSLRLWGEPFVHGYSQQYNVSSEIPLLILAGACCLLVFPLILCSCSWVLEKKKAQSVKEAFGSLLSTIYRTYIASILSFTFLSLFVLSLVGVGFVLERLLALYDPSISGRSIALALVIFSMVIAVRMIVNLLALPFLASTVQMPIREALYSIPYILNRSRVLTSLLLLMVAGCVAILAVMMVTNSLSLVVQVAIAAAVWLCCSVVIDFLVSLQNEMTSHFLHSLQEAGTPLLSPKDRVEIECDVEEVVPLASEKLKRRDREFPEPVLS